jgi:gas vesicle protein
MSENNDIGSFVAGVIVGGLVGAAVALLLAPQSGEETRTMIRDKSIEIKDRAMEVGQDALSRAEAAVEEARLRADAAFDELQGRTEELARLAREKGVLLKQPPAEATPPAEAGGEVAG